MHDLNNPLEMKAGVIPLYTLLGGTNGIPGATVFQINVFLFF